jgi:SPP1 gp7 family putative phage head morphogenesis protein
MPKRRKKIVPMKYPIGIEYAYRRQLLWLNKQHEKAINKRLLPKLKILTEEVSDIHAIPTGVIRQDAGWQDDLYDAFQRIAEDMVGPKRETAKAMTRFAPQINEFNKNEWKSLIRSQYGVNPTREDPGTYIPLMQQWAKDNALLINDIPDKAAKQMQELIQDALISGKTQDDMIDDIKDIVGGRLEVSDSRARLIARDQVAKLNGRFTRERQTESGVDSYVWRTVGDERVRETHDEVDGQTFSWSIAPEETDGNHPGEDYQCRCWAEPVLPEALDVSADLLDEEELEDAE